MCYGSIETYHSFLKDHPAPTVAQFSVARGPRFTRTI